MVEPSQRDELVCFIFSLSAPCCVFLKIRFTLRPLPVVTHEGGFLEKDLHKIDQRTEGEKQEARQRSQNLPKQGYYYGNRGGGIGAGASFSASDSNQHH